MINRPRLLFTLSNVRIIIVRLVDSRITTISKSQLPFLYNIKASVALAWLDSSPSHTCMPNFLNFFLTMQTHEAEMDRVIIMVQNKVRG